jgi:hypothetical protein
MLRFLDDLGVRATLFAIAENLNDPDKGKAVRNHG